LTLGTSSSEMILAHSVAIVGLGPKGLYCLERLLAEFNSRPLRRPLHINVFNRSANFGASPIYDPEQPEYILVNISVGEIDLWTAEDPPIVGGRGPSFLSWYQETFHPQTPLTGDEYLSRAVVGRYLIEGFHRTLNNLPLGVTVSCHVGEVVDIRPHGRAYQLEFVADSGNSEVIQIDKVLLATGHSRLRPGTDEKRYQSFISRHSGAAFIPFVYPVVESMSQIPASARVAMRGVGLTFIDAALELTEGCGGSFERAADGSLSYEACGKEPQSIIPFSRTGLPMTPKAHDLPICERPLTFFTHGALAELRKKASDGKLDLERDLWPIFELEMELQYYRVVMRDSDELEQLESCGNDAQAMRGVIDSYLRAHPDKERFDYRQVLDPVGERRFESGAQYASFIERYMEHEIARARLGHAGCGVKAAIDIWYEVRKSLGSVLQFGGLNPESHRKLIEYYYPRLKRVAFGPPIINIEKLLSLQRAGILDFSVARNPRVLTDEGSGCFELRCDEIPEAIAQAEILVDARYPSVDIPRDATPLYRNLHRRGMVRAYENRLMARDSFAYRPGAIDMTEGSRFVVDAEGTGNEDITVIGIPTEGNLVGNLTLARDDYSRTWAAEIISQLRCREETWSYPFIEAV
jgi:FAD-NAD(P)-binding